MGLWFITLTVQMSDGPVRHAFLRETPWYGLQDGLGLRVRLLGAEGFGVLGI